MTGLKSSDEVYGLGLRLSIFGLAVRIVRMGSKLEFKTWLVITLAVQLPDNRKLFQIAYKTGFRV